MRLQYESADLVIFESALFRTTSTLLVGDHYLIIVDPNWLPIEVQFIRDYIDNLNLNVQKYILFTHSDYDHIIGYGMFPDFESIASAAFVQQSKQESILKQINDFDDSNYILRNYQITYPTITTIIDDSQIMNFGTDEFQFFSGIGHNDDGIIIFNKTKGILILGDYLSNIEFPYVYHSFKLYEEVLDNLQLIINEHPISFLITGHGDYTSVKNEMLQRIQESRNYIHELRLSVAAGEEFNFEQLMKDYNFPKVMLDFHQKNISLMKQELKRS